MSQIEHPSPSPEALRQGYEPSTISVRGLLIFLAIFITTAVVLQIGIWELLKAYMAIPRLADVATSAAPVPQRFPSPNLQPIEKHNQLPWQDLADLQREKGAIFSEMGWSIDPLTKEPLIPDQLVARLAKERSPSPGTPGEGRGEGDFEHQMARLPNEPPPPPSPGVPGEGVKGGDPQAGIASTPPANRGQP